MKKSFLLATAIFCAMNIFAQIDTVVKIQDIIVKSKAIDNYFHTEIDTSLLKNAKNLQVSDFLQQTGKVYVKNYGNYGLSTVAFRGKSASHTAVYWNNVPLNASMSGQTDFSLLPAFFVDKIQLSSGIKSLSNSNGALGGSVNFYSSASTAHNLQLQLVQHIASFHNFSTFSEFKAKKNKVYFLTRFMYKYGKNDFVFENTALPDVDTQRLENADFKQISFLQQMMIPVKKNFVKPFLWLTATNRNIPPIMSFSGFYRSEKQNDAKIIAGTETNLKFSGIKLKTTQAFVFNSLDYFAGDSVLAYPENFFIVKNNSQSSEKTFFNRIETAIFFGNIDFSGLIMNKFSYVSTYDSAGFVSAGYDASRFENNLKMIFFYNGKKNVDFTGIMSFLHAGKIFYAPDFSIGMVKKSTSGQYVFSMNAGKNTHLPTLNDLYWQPGGNPLLKPEKSWSVDATQKLTFGKKIKTTAEITAFASLVNDWIIWQPTEFHYWTASNIKKVFSRGFEANLEIVRKTEILQKIITNYSLTYSTTVETYLPDDLSAGKQLIYIPHGIFNFLYFVSKKNISGGISVNYTGKRYTTSSNEENTALDSYWLLNVDFSYDLKVRNKIISAGLRLNNLFDESYQVVLYRPMPGRNFDFYVSIKFLK